MYFISQKFDFHHIDDWSNFIFSRNRIVSLSLLEFKQLLLILCNTQHFGQLTMEEFNLAADHNRCVNRFRFESIIKVISKFFSYLEESSFFRSHSISGMIKECFEQVNIFRAFKCTNTSFYNTTIKVLFVSFFLFLYVCSALAWLV